MDRIDLKKVRPDTRTPDPKMTKEEWQTYFRALRMMVTPIQSRKMFEVKLRMHGKDAYDDLSTEYHGDTIWQCYCKFINGVLHYIRLGEVDYCYFIYQIAELLKYEHDRLRTEWLPSLGCFRVWLE